MNGGHVSDPTSVPGLKCIPVQVDVGQTSGRVDRAGCDTTPRRYWRDKRERRGAALRQASAVEEGKIRTIDGR